MADKSEDLGRVALRGSASAGAAQLVKVGIQLGSVVLLSRLLSPDDFGLMAALAPFLAFVGMFQDLGLREALTQRDVASPAFVDQIFYATLGLGLFCALVVAGASPLLAWFYGDPRLVGLTLLTSVSVLLGSVSGLPAALLNRALAFQTLAAIDIVSSLAGFAAALIGALLGAGYWSLAASPLVATLVLFALGFRRAGYRPGPFPKQLLDREAVVFGANLTGFQFLNFFARNIDNVLVGRRFGGVALGYYDRAYKLLLFPLQTVNNPLSRVMVPLLSRLQREPARLRRAYLRATGQLALVTVVGTAAVVPVADELIALLFGARWAEVAPIFAWLGLAGFVQPIGNSAGWLFIAQARTGTMMRWGIYSSLTSVAAFAIGLSWGVTGVAASYAISECVRAPVLFHVMAQVGPVTRRDLYALQLPLLGAAGATWLTVTFGLRTGLGLTGVPLLAASAATSLAYGPLWLALVPEGRAVLRETLGLLRRLRDARGGPHLASA